MVGRARVAGGGTKGLWAELGGLRVKQKVRAGQWNRELWWAGLGTV